MFDPYTQDLRALRAELEAFGALLQSGIPLSEAIRILPFCATLTASCSSCGFADHALGPQGRGYIGLIGLGFGRCRAARGIAASGY